MAISGGRPASYRIRTGGMQVLHDRRGEHGGDDGEDEQRHHHLHQGDAAFTARHTLRDGANTQFSACCSAHCNPSLDDELVVDTNIQQFRRGVQAGFA